MCVFALLLCLPALRKSGVMVSAGCPSVQPGLLYFAWKKGLHTLRTGGKGNNLTAALHGAQHTGSRQEQAVWLKTLV